MLPARLATRIMPFGECWLWTGFMKPDGYGQLGSRPAHRVVYETVRGSIPAGLTLDHLCRVRACVNPAHLEPVTAVENARRGVSPPALNARKRSCEHGHPFDAANTYVRPDGNRACRVCVRLAVAAYRKRRIPV